jgi:hypothetical protein
MVEKPTRLAIVIAALKAHGIKEEELDKIQSKIAPLLLVEPEIVAGSNDTHNTTNIHIHIDVHDFEE